MRLELRVTLWLTVLLGAAAALTLLGMAKFEQQNLEKQSTDTATLLAQATENSLEVSMLNNAPEDIRQTVRNMKEGTLIGSISVYRRNATAWVSSEPGAAMDPTRRDALLASMNDNTPVTSNGDGELSVFIPVPKQAECVGCHAEESDVLGAVEVRMDERPFQAQFARSARYSLFFAAIPLLLGIALSVIAVRRSLLKPLAAVGDAAAKLGGGDLSVRVPTTGGGELAEVSATFNDMAERLESQAADLVGTVERLRTDLEGMEEIQTLLSSGAGLSAVLSRTAAHLGSALGATGVGIWRTADEPPDAGWGGALPGSEAVKFAALEGKLTTSEGDLMGLSDDRSVAWAVVPARRDGRCVAVVGMVWDPPRPLDRARRDLLVSLVGLVGVAAENADLFERLQKKEQTLQGLLRKTLAAQEEERRRISRELHDETSQVLSALIMNIDLLESQIEAKDPTAEKSVARVEAVKALAEEAARNLDKMMLELRPALLDELGLVAALRWYAAQVSDLWGLPIEFAGGKMGRLADHVEVAAFRIVQESLSNCVRHAHATKARVRIAVERNVLRVEVADDGTGFDVTSVSARARTGEAVGLEGMRERAELVGGTLWVESQAGVGTTVTAELPLAESERVE